MCSLRLLVLVLPVLAACPVIEAPPPGEVARRSLTAQLADRVVGPAVVAFADATAALTTTTTAWAAAPQDAAARAAAQQAWRDAMTIWQGLEVAHFGPAGSPANFVGGQGLRDRIYAWPQVNLCAVDTQLLADEFAEDGWVASRLPNVIGLAPLEYVLFVEVSGNQCPADSGINSDGSWDALDEAARADRRARFAAVLAKDVELVAGALRDAWVGDGGFAADLRTAGANGSTFSLAQQALDEVYAGLFTVELITKDKRLAIPAGLHVDCAAASCPNKAESRFSRTSKENVAENLRSTRRIFLGEDGDGADGPGFDDLLDDAGAADLATTMTQNLDAAIAVVAGFDGTFEDALVTEPARVQAVYDAVKGFTDDFKSTFPSTLGLRVPDEGAGDND